jgi:hypothetical protein
MVDRFHTKQDVMIKFERVPRVLDAIGDKDGADKAGVNIRRSVISTSELTHAVTIYHDSVMRPVWNSMTLASPTCPSNPKVYEKCVKRYDQ